jgi:DnaJ-class molecular chaperone
LAKPVGCNSGRKKERKKYMHTNDCLANLIKAQSDRICEEVRDAAIDNQQLKAEICPKCNGEMTVVADNHLGMVGCPGCGGTGKLSAV